MPHARIVSSLAATLLLSSLWSGSSIAQTAQPGYAPPPPAQSPTLSPYAPPPGYYAPAPDYYGPQPYPAPVAYAPATPPGYHTHDGFYLRLHFGPGYLHSSANTDGYKLSTSGFGFTFAFAAGGVVAPNLAIYGEIQGTSVADPTMDNGITSATANGVSATVAGLGPGVAYYLDNNMYLSGTLLFCGLSLSDTDSNESFAQTDTGVGTVFTFGKEWWVSTDWGIGASGQMSFASMKAKNADYRWTTVTASLLFSATYN
jgi:hypothetical protein